MSTPHLLNLAAHVGAGGLAILLGFAVLGRTKGDATHRRWGLWLVGITTIVVATAALGLAVFRWMPLFALLTLLVGYQLLGGWRAARTREAGPQRIDLAFSLLAVAIAAVIVPTALNDPMVARAVVIGSCSALGTVLSYDLLRWLAPKRWHAAAWRYEHLYKMNAALFGMISAFVGNTVRAWQPWSQLLPSAIGILAIVVQASRLARAEQRAKT
ncbi:MAG: hypothetical protein IT357_09530 [Gemmatimonadaceae bacterium]|nr:hypothetical protein [Gemmatimonadaceae bacterium]